MEKPGFQKCETALTPVPKHIFRSPFTWCCCEAARSYFVYAWSLWAASMILIMVYVVPRGYSFWSIFVTIILCISIGAACPAYSIWNEIMVGRTVLADLTALADSVDNTFKLGHGIGPEKWNEIAAQKNNKLYIGGFWKTPYCFYDGTRCESFFRHYFIKPSFEGTDEKISLHCDDDNKKNTNPVCRYQDRIEEQFETWSQCCTTGLTEEPKQCLSKTIFRTKFTWSCYQISRTYSFWFLLLTLPIYMIIFRG